jgi:eukaryotic-like serine/threonine-protein kinase
LPSSLQSGWATGTEDGTVALWDVSDPRAVTKRGELKPTLDGGVVSLAFSPDGALMAATSTKGQVLLWDTATLAPRGSFSPVDGEKAFPLSQSSVAWDISRDVRRSFDLTRRGGGLAFHPTGLLAGGADNLIRFWDARDPNRPSALPQLFAREHQAAVGTVAFSQDRHLMASTEINGQRIYLWRVEVDAALDPMVRLVLLGKVEPGVTGAISGLAFDHDSKQLAWATRDGKVGYLDVALDSWKRHAWSVANRNLTDAEIRRYLRFLPSAEGR